MTSSLTIRWIGVLAWAGVIVAFSSIPGLSTDLARGWDLVLRKLAHIIEFTIFAFLLFRAINHGRKPTSTESVIVIAVTIVFAMTDEIHQAFVPNRTGLPTDVAIDAIGAVLGTILGLVNTKKQNQTPRA